MYKLFLRFLFDGTRACDSHIGTRAGEHACPYSFVDTRIGTANDGLTDPVVGMPFAMTGWTPESQPTEDKCLSPSYYEDTRLTGFRGGHWLSGGCAQDYGSVTLMPTVSELNISPRARASFFVISPR
jgi:putative alpha-1,2-mannosidase